MENMMAGPTLTPYDIESEKFLAQRLADRCSMTLNLNNQAQRSMQQVESQKQQIDALAKQVEELTKAGDAKDTQIATMTEELTALRLSIKPAVEPDHVSGD